MNLFANILDLLEDAYVPPSETPIYIRDQPGVLAKDFGEDVENELIRLINLNFGSRLVNLNDVLPNFPGYDIYDIDDKVRVGSAKGTKTLSPPYRPGLSSKQKAEGVKRDIQNVIAKPCLHLCSDGILLYAEVEDSLIKDLVVCEVSRVDTPSMGGTLTLPKLMKVGGVRVIEDGSHHWQRFTSFAE